MKLEAWIARQPGIRVVCGINGPALAELGARARNAQDCCGLISFGVAGGLVPNLRPGTWIVGSKILWGESRYATHELWSKNVGKNVGCSLWNNCERFYANCATRREGRLHTEPAAAAVDMESHIVANVAAAHGLPMVAVRVIIDPAEHALPRAAVVPLCSNGAVDIAALMRSVIGCLAEFSGLMRTGRYAFLAGTALVRRRRILRSLIALADGGEETLSVENVTE